MVFFSGMSRPPCPRAQQRRCRYFALRRRGADLSRRPVMVGATLHTLGQQALGALGVTGAEAGLEEGIVEDVALGPAPPDLDDPRSERIDALDRRSVVPAGERLHPLGQRHDHVAEETAPGL